MHLVYLDESGNTGNDLKDLQQPIFVLTALIVPEECWQSLEAELVGALKKALPSSAHDELEVHAADLRAGRGQFKGMELALRVGLRNEWLKQGKRIKLSHGAAIN